MSLRRATAIGGVWNYGTFAVGKLLIFISTVILARLLVPGDFGLLALGLVAINYLDRISGLGVGAALIYRQEDPRRTAGVALSLSLVVDAALTLSVILAAPWIAAAFENPQITPIVRVLAVGFFIANLKNIPESLIKKDLAFHRRVVPELARSVVKGGVAILMAWWGWGVWSLVWGQVAGGATGMLLYWGLCRWRPRLSYDRAIAGAILAYGTPIVLLSLLGTLGNSLDYLFIGLRMDAKQAGYYAMAFRMPELAILSVGYTMSHVLFPAYARIQHDPEQLRGGYLMTLRYMAILTAPLGVGLYMVSPEFVTVFYSQRWTPSIGSMQMLSLFALVHSLTGNEGDVYKAVGRLDVLYKLILVQLLVTAPVLWWAAGQGIYAVSIGLLVTGVILSVLRLAVVGRFLRLKTLDLFHALRPAAGATLVMFTGTTALRWGLSGYGAPLVLVLSVLTSALLYGAALCVFHPDLIRHAASMIGPAKQDDRP
jgi:O-antigen/teichoic acid export membrane protein